MAQKESKHGKGPNFIKYFIPVIDVLKSLGGSGKPSEVTDLVIQRCEIPEYELELKNKNGGSTVRNRIAWARFYLVKGGVLDSSKRGVWLLKDYTISINNEDEAFIFFKKVQVLFEVDKEAQHPETKGNPIEEVIEKEIEEDSYGEKLLELLKKLPPSGFEKLCQRLLRESGFTKVVVTGQSGDGGIDGYGVLEINPLMSFKVLFQSKRYKDIVGTDKVRDFRGAMAGRADKGIIITTGRFTQDAKNEAVRDGVPPIELVDGDKLVSMFEKLELGLLPKIVYDIDYAFFEEYNK